MTGEVPRRRPTAELITEAVAGRVRHYRERLGLSQGDLADELVKVGVNWKRATVIGLETRAPDSRGQGPGRDALTVEELLGLALVLGVPPVGLLFDVSESDPTAITSRVSCTPLDAALWAIGREPLDGARANIEAWREIQDPLVNAWYVADAVAALRSLMAVREAGFAGATLDDEEIGDDTAARMDRRVLAQIEKALRYLRAIEHPTPKLPEFVERRATELGVDLFAGD